MAREVRRGGTPKPDSNESGWSRHPAESQSLPGLMLAEEFARAMVADKADDHLANLRHA
jgi:hypothetical protein